MQLPTVAQAKAFTEAPYRLEWRGDRRVSEVPFAALDPLPQFPIEVNGVPLHAIFDTGGDTLILDDEVARTLGITSAATATGTFGGGGKFPTGSFTVKSLTLGPLRQTDARGSYGGRPPESYWGRTRGFIEDGLPSHGFLKRYGSWTIDFDSMTYLFER